ncbi:MAG: ribbon-helix-helix protein, CopG family [Firmicutes bacterium]|nr:ribbon-helix-helix protein, CopG family [Bacillota bacterium]
MTISIRLDDNDSKLIKAYAELNGMTVSEAIRKAMLERIEDEFDLKAYEEALAEYQNDPVTYSLEEMEREINEIHG